MNISLLYEYSKHPEPFSAGTGNIWTEPHLASQMLKAHLNQNVDAASRKEKANWYTSESDFFRPGKHLVLESTVPYPNDVWLEQYIVVDEAKTVVYRNWYHEYTPQTIKKVLLQAGFSKVQVSEKLYGLEQEKKWHGD